MSSTLPVGHTVAGRYQVAHFLGAGDLGEVYDVRDLTTGYAYALKLFPEDFARSAQAWDAYRNASDRAAQLGIDAVARVYEYSVEPNFARPYALGEYIVFPTAKQLVEQNGPLSTQDLVAIYEVLLPALHAAHQAGVFHLALKPTNLFLENKSGQGWEVRVSDFGVAAARILAPPPPGWPATPGWLSAEQADPSTPPAATMDIYTLGLLAFYLLTGRSPFRSCQTEGQPDLSLLWAEMTAPLPKASQRARELGTMLSPTLDAWFERALAVSPSQRFQNLPEMLEALKNLQGQPVRHSGTIQPGPMGAAVPPPAVPPSGQPPSFGGEGPTTTESLDGLLEEEVDDEAATVVAMPEQLREVAEAEQSPPAVRPAAGMPPPPPPGGANAARPAAGMPPPPPPGGANASFGHQAQGMPPPPAPPAAPNAQFVQTASREALPLTKRKFFLPAVIGGSVALLAVVLILVFALSGSDDTQAQAAQASASASSAAASSSAAAKPSAAPPAASGAKEEKKEEKAEDAGAEEKKPEDALLRFACSPPSCDKVVCDGKKVDNPEEGIRLKAGRHVCKATKKGYYRKTKKIQVEAGNDEQITFEMKKIVHVARPRRIPRPAKTCGTFLNPCK